MITAEKLNQVYDKMRSGLFIVTSSYRKHNAGCTCLWVTRSSFNPPLLALYLAPTRHTCEVILKSKRFALHTVPEGGVALARRFGLSSQRDGDKFEGVDWTPGLNNVPLLNDAGSVIECRLATFQNLGDHSLLLGEVLSAQIQHDIAQLMYDPESFYNIGEERREIQMGEAGVG
jgi:flavin reductase (DIM6/NTAB) family NADH-FMN oxidoreductase RutF